MRWFRREEKPVRAVEPPQPGPALDEADRRINRSAGQLPIWATVQARWITDTLRTILGTTQQQALEVSTVVLVTATVADYLPTTLDRYLAIDENQRDKPRADGRTPVDHLRDQLADLHAAATEALAAVRDRDADALTTQGAFLRTKFTRSDLDLW
ncbi:hypothetical protein [Actinoplanes sp. URMC 104]|uniref:hypothetical protein n=1 Tax=Actinoplanes sp. URMC 104 TaxID=3423409 RepID=UPI003F19785E